MICPSCLQEKDETEFHQRTIRVKEVIKGECKRCHRRNIWRQQNKTPASRKRNRDFQKKLREIKQQNKLKGVKEQNYICPGCGRDFSTCPDYALIMCFERSHYHSMGCDKRKIKSREDKEFFYSCRQCNVGAQNDKCGYWKKPNLFVCTCHRKTKEKLNENA